MPCEGGLNRLRPPVKARGVGAGASDAGRPGPVDIECVEFVPPPPRARRRAEFVDWRRQGPRALVQCRMDAAGVSLRDAPTTIASSVLVIMLALTPSVIRRWTRSQYKCKCCKGTLQPTGQRTRVVTANVTLSDENESVPPTKEWKPKRRSGPNGWLTRGGAGKAEGEVGRWRREYRRKADAWVSPSCREPDPSARGPTKG